LPADQRSSRSEWRKRRGERVRTRTVRRTLAASLSIAVVTCGVAHAGGGLNVYDEGHLHYLRSSGDRLIDEGKAAGTVPGKVIVYFEYTGNPTVYAHFTIYARAGTISGYAKGRLSNPTSPSPSFRGALSLSGGAGHYAHAHGSGELYGVFYRRNYAMTVQTRGRLDY